MPCQCGRQTNQKDGVCVICKMDTRIEKMFKEESMTRFKVCPDCKTEQKSNAAPKCHSCGYIFFVTRRKGKESPAAGPAAGCFDDIALQIKTLSLGALRREIAPFIETIKEAMSEIEARLT